MDNTKPFLFRGVQLDLARQMETLEFIFEFIDFIASSGYNTLVLYLEGRIKTESFPYPAKGEYYTPAEMAQVVSYAAKKGIDVVPVVSVLGHARNFLKHKELAHLAEIRGDGTGPLEETSSHVFCLSLPETLEFIKTYLTEMAEIFPGRYFHLGCDEAWDIGCCPLCRERVRKGETHADLFTAHLIAVHEFVKHELHKEVIIWDDLFECYPGALERMDRDIILCCWQYERSVDIPKAHFKSRLEEDLLAKYEELGFKYLIAPSSYLLYAGNIESFTGYADRHNPLGGILTVWEQSLNFMHKEMPLIRYAGKLWSGENPLFADSMQEIFGCDDEIFINALRSCHEIKMTHPTRLSLGGYLAGPLTNLEAIIKSTCETNRVVLRAYLEKCDDGLARDILEDLIVSLEWKRIMFELRSVVEELFSFGQKRPAVNKRKQLTVGVAEMVDAFLARKLHQWRRFRPGISSSKIEKTFSQFSKEIIKLAEISSRAEGVLEVKFFLPDQHNAQKCSFEIEFEDGSVEKVAEGIFKDYELSDSFFCFKFPYYTQKRPVAVKVESWLHGGMGLAYLQAVSKTKSFVPASITNVTGVVETPHHLLVNDLRYCFMGETDMGALFQMPELAQRKHGLALGLSEK